MAAVPSVPEEVKGYCNYIAYRAARVKEYFRPSDTLPEDEETVMARLEDSDGLEPHELFDDAEEGWTDVLDSSRELPQETKQDIIRIAQEGGPIKQAVVEFQQKATKSAKEATSQALEDAGSIIRFEANQMAFTVGWVLNCTSIDDLRRKLLAKYPSLKLTGPALKELYESFNIGSEIAARTRHQAQILPPEFRRRLRPLEEADKSKPVVETERIGQVPEDYERFGGMEDISLDEDAPQDDELAAEEPHDIAEDLR